MPARHFPVSWTLLAPEALAGRLQAAYGLENVQCRLFTVAMRDVYWVADSDQHYIFYLYRAGNRPEAEIAGEWRFVDFLAQEGLPVLPALRTREGEAVLSFVAPEGRRYGVLTRHEDAGHFRHRPGLPAARAYGRTIARLHEVSTKLDTDFGRPPADPRRQLAEATRAFAYAFPDRPEDHVFLQQAAQQLQTRLPAVPDDPPFYGMIHGDVIQANALVSDDGQRVTLIDFDLCGPGRRIYDVASFFITLHGTPDEREMRAAFLEGYVGVRMLKRPELEALPLYEAVRAVFSIGVPAGQINIWGRATVEPYLDEGLNRLRILIGRLGES